jgi:hypothetical protein
LDAYDKHGLSGLTRFCLPDSVTEEEDDDWWQHKATTYWNRR